MTVAEGGWEAEALRERLAERVNAAALPPLADRVLEQISQYYLLLAKWNRRLNLTALSFEGFPAPAIDRLLVEPLVAAELISDLPAVWLDLGSGGGSPAIPLKIVRPQLSLAMVESRAKKAAFLREVVSVLGLEITRVLTTRIENLLAELGALSADVITVRAVRFDQPIVETVSELLRPAGHLLIWSGIRGISKGCQRRVEGEPPKGFREVQRRELPSSGGWVTALEKM